jgi:hypothetical protein
LVIAKASLSLSSEPTRLSLPLAPSQRGCSKPPDSPPWPQLPALETAQPAGPLTGVLSCPHCCWSLRIFPAKPRRGKLNQQIHTQFFQVLVQGVVKGICFVVTSNNTVTMRIFNSIL